MLEVWTSDETEGKEGSSAAPTNERSRLTARAPQREDRLRRVPALQELVYLLE